MCSFHQTFIQGVSVYSVRLSVLLHNLYLKHTWNVIRRVWISGVLIVEPRTLKDPGSISKALKRTKCSITLSGAINLGVNYCHTWPFFRKSFVDRVYCSKKFLHPFKRVQFSNVILALTILSTFKRKIILSRQLYKLQYFYINRKIIMTFW